VKSKHTFLCSNAFFQKLCRLWQNVEKCDTARKGIDVKIIWSVRFTCWINKTTDTHSEYVIPIALPWQWCLRKSISMLRYMYAACLVRNYTGFTVLRMPLYACFVIDMYLVTNHWNTHKLYLRLDTKYMYASSYDFSLPYEQKTVQLPPLAYTMKKI